MQALTKFLETISIILSPPAWLLYFLIASSNKGLFVGDRVSDLTILGIFLIPLIYFFYLYKTKKISNLDITIREERYRSLMVMNLFLFLLLLYLKLHNFGQFYTLMLIFFLINALTSIITFKYKISFHMTYTIIFSTFINFLYDFQLPILFLTIPLIAWSRIYLKQHTYKQVLLACVIDIPLLFLLLR